MTSTRTLRVDEAGLLAVVMITAQGTIEDVVAAMTAGAFHHGGAIAALPAGATLSGAVSRYERQLIESALRQAGGVQRQAAQLLGLKSTTLNEKIKRLGIQP